MFVYHLKQVSLSRMFLHHFTEWYISLYSSDICVVIRIIHKIVEFAKLRSTTLGENEIRPPYLMLCLENVIVNMPITLNLSTS